MSEYEDAVDNVLRQHYEKARDDELGMGVELMEYDRQVALALRANDVPFAALLMAAMLRADTNNLALLKVAFPVHYAYIKGS